uniref:Oxidoreductase NAD binding domain containing 1 n=1 Tax=Canis lupus dingo TaxID=286419 RepID=A0A8C0LUI4_CANLU
MACAAVMIPGLLRSSVGTICTPATSLRLTSSTLRHLTLTSIMKSKRKTDHLERTASVIRREGIQSGEIDFIFDPADLFSEPTVYAAVF